MADTATDRDNVAGAVAELQERLAREEEERRTMHASVMRLEAQVVKILRLSVGGCTVCCVSSGIHEVIEVEARAAVLVRVLVQCTRSVYKGAIHFRECVDR